MTRERAEEKRRDKTGRKPVMRKGKKLKEKEQHQEKNEKEVDPFQEVETGGHLAAAAAVTTAAAKAAETAKAAVAASRKQEEEEKGGRARKVFKENWRKKIP